MYAIQRHSRTEFIPLRGHRYHVRRWGEAAPGQRPLFMVHGWMDVSASYQFVVDALQAERQIIAPDWRGFGLSSGPWCDHYTFADYLGDLECLLDHYAPGQAVDLVGHSMGGNVAMMYAGVRPERIHRLINLEGFGMPQTRAAQAPGRYARWLDEIRAVGQGGLALKTYGSLEAVAERLRKTNPRLAHDKSLWLAGHWAQADIAEDGQTRWRILGEEAHKVVSAQLFRVDEMLEIMQRITAPVLAVEASDDSLAQWWKGQYSLDEYHQRLQRIDCCKVARVQDAGHMLHHDQPTALARLIEEFLDR